MGGSKAGEGTSKPPPLEIGGSEERIKSGKEEGKKGSEEESKVGRKVGRFYTLVPWVGGLRMSVFQLSCPSRPLCVSPFQKT